LRVIKEKKKKVRKGIDSSALPRLVHARPFEPQSKVNFEKYQLLAINAHKMAPKRPNGSKNDPGITSLEKLPVLGPTF